MQEIEFATLAAMAEEMLGLAGWQIAMMAAILLVVWLLLAFWAPRLRSGLGIAALCGAAIGVVVILILPAWTHSGFSQFGGAVDYVVIASAGLAVAVIACLILLPLVAMLRGRS